jgi:hypothetical protein
LPLSKVKLKMRNPALEGGLNSGRVNKAAPAANA